MLAMTASVQDFEYRRMATMLQQMPTHINPSPGGVGGGGGNMDSHEMMMFYPGIYPHTISYSPILSHTISYSRLLYHTLAYYLILVCYLTFYLAHPDTHSDTLSRTPILSHLRSHISSYTLEPVLFSLFPLLCTPTQASPCP